jgi:outer membrane lipoprotein-sorting protein
MLLGGVLALVVCGCKSGSSSDLEPIGSKSTGSAVAENTSPGSPGNSTNPSETKSTQGTATEQEPAAAQNGAGLAPDRSAIPGKGAQNSDEQAPTAAEGWDPSTVKAEDLAKSADAKVAQLKRTSAEVSVSFRDKKGAGRSKCQVAILDPTKYRIEFADIGGPKIGLSRNTWISDGKQVAVLTSDQGLASKESSASFKMPSTASLAGWILASPRIMFSPLTGGHPLTDLVAQVKKAGGASGVKVEERSFDYKGHKFHQQRLVIKVTPTGAPTVDLTILIDKDYGLPVTIDGMTTLIKTQSNLHWDVQWRLDPNQTFASDAFVVPLKSETIKR